MACCNQSLNLLAPELLYSGVWQDIGNGSLGAYWNYATLEFRTDSPFVVFGISCTADVIIQIDRTGASYAIKNGEVRLELDGGMHSIKLIGRYDSRPILSSITIAAGASVAAPEKRLYMQFIGDSISHYNCSFSFQTPEALGVDYSVVAQCGLALHDGWGWYDMPAGMTIRRGMETMYHHLEFPCETVSHTSYNYKICRTPDVIVIFLGTNDFLDTEENKKNHHIEIFANAYQNFVGRLREHFPNVKIFMLEALSDSYCRVEGIEKAYEAVSAKYDDVTLVRNDKWGIELGEDGTHPTTAGYNDMSVKLAEYLKKELHL